MRAVTISTRCRVSASSTKAAAFDRPVEPSATAYFSVDTLLPVLRRIEALGGSAGEHAQDMGPYFTALCTDDQGTTFGVMSARSTEASATGPRSTTIDPDRCTRFG